MKEWNARSCVRASFGGHTSERVGEQLTKIKSEMRFSQWGLAVSALIAAAALTTVSGDLKSTCNTTVKTLNISDANSHEIFYLGKMGNGVYISCVAYEVTLINPTAQCKGTEQNYELDMQFYNPIKSPPSFSFGRMFRGSVQRAWMWGIGYFLYSFVTFRALDGTLCPVNVRISIDATIALDANYNNVPWLTRTVPNVVTRKGLSTFQFDQVVRPSQDARGGGAAQQPPMQRACPRQQSCRRIATNCANL